jgi:hypothetical protein
MMKVKRQLQRGVLATLAAAGMLLAVALPALADDRPDGAELASAGPMMMVICIFFVVSALGILWSWNNGELKEPEEVKYEMLDMCSDEEDYWSTPEDEEDEFDDEDEDGGLRTPTGEPTAPAPVSEDSPVAAGR